MSPSCNLSHQCQGPWGSGLLTLHSWASSFQSNVEFCPAQAIPGGSRRRARGGKYMQHSVPADTAPCPPWGNGQQGGRQGPQGWEIPAYPRMGQDSTWSQLMCRWRWPRREQEIPGTLLQPRAALSSSSSCPRGRSSPWPQAGLEGPGAWFSCKDWRQTCMVCQQPHSRPSAVSRCSRCVPACQDGSKGTGNPSQEDPGAVPPCPLAAGGHQQLLGLAWSSSTRRPRLQGWTNLPGMLLPMGWEWQCLEHH